MTPDHKTDGSAPDAENPLPAAEDHTTDHTSYEVGYGKPPKSRQFKPGQSGNPRGRRKGTRNLRTYLREELSTRVTVNKDGKRRRLPKAALIASQLVNSAIKGNSRSIEYLMKLADMMEMEHSNEGSETAFSEAERKAVTAYLYSIKGADEDDGRGVDE